MSQARSVPYNMGAVNFTLAHIPQAQLHCPIQKELRLFAYLANNCNCDVDFHSMSRRNGKTRKGGIDCDTFCTSLIERKIEWSQITEPKRPNWPNKLGNWLTRKSDNQNNVRSIRTNTNQHISACALTQRHNTHIKTTGVGTTEILVELYYETIDDRKAKCILMS